jgi:superfamily II DNA/RNA helicase
MSFNNFDLNPQILKAIEASGYTDPTPVQKAAIPEILLGKDLVVCAPTGSGKTAAFILPALNRVSEPNPFKKARILVLTPTRELATQITNAAFKYGKFMKFNTANLVGGMSYRQQLNDLSRPVDLIVATPGRLLDHLDSRRVDLSGVEMLILDEADRMLDMGFIEDVQAIAKKTAQDRQTLLFSATVEGKLGSVIKNLLRDPLQLDLSTTGRSAPQIKQELYMTDSPKHKLQLLEHFLVNEKIFKAIIFSATKIGADRLAAELLDQGYSAAPLHGDLKQNQRNRTVDLLRKNKLQFVVATDVAARGIDISDMTHVINYDLPRFCEDYVHRIGRTGRAGKTGIAISFALPSDKRHIDKIERYIGQSLEVLTVAGLEPTHKPSKSSGKDKPGRGGSKKDFSRSFNKGKPFREKSDSFSPRRGERSSESRFKSRGDDAVGSARPKRDGAFGKPKSYGSEPRFSDDRPARPRSESFERRERPSAKEGQRGGFGRPSGDKEAPRFARRPAGEGSDRRSGGDGAPRFDRARKAPGSDRRGGDSDAPRFARRPAGEGSDRRSGGAEGARFDRTIKAPGSDRRGGDSDAPRFDRARKAPGSDRRGSDSDAPRFDRARKAPGSDRRGGAEGSRFSKDKKEGSSFKPRKTEGRGEGEGSRFAKSARPSRDGDRKKPGVRSAGAGASRSKSADNRGAGLRKREEKK